MTKLTDAQYYDLGTLHAEYNQTETYYWVVFLGVEVSEQLDQERELYEYTHTAEYTPSLALGHAIKSFGLLMEHPGNLDFWNQAIEACMADQRGWTREHAQQEVESQFGMTMDEAMEMDVHDAAMHRAESGYMSKDEAEELGVSLDEED